MIHMVNGRQVNVPLDSDGKLDSYNLRKIAGIDKSRSLILQMPDGSNQIINPGEKLMLNPGSHFSDQPGSIRGTYKEVMRCQQ